MAKIHMRLSVELDIPNETLIAMVDSAMTRNGALREVNYNELPIIVRRMIDEKKYEPCDWDDGGYVPDCWLTYDAVDSGLYDADEYGVRRKENK